MNGILAWEKSRPFGVADEDGMGFEKETVVVPDGVTAWEQEDRLPDPVGSVRQTAWGRPVRHEFLAALFGKLSLSSQLRIGFNAIKRVSGNAGKAVADIWAGHPDAIADHCDDGVFKPVIAAQKLWARNCGPLASCSCNGPHRDSSSGRGS